MTEITHFIARRNAPGRSGRSSPVFDPATGERTGTLPLADASEVGYAVAAASAAFPEWADASI